MALRKEGPLGTKAEREAAGKPWRWNTGPHNWQWDDQNRGLNLSLVHRSGHVQPVLHCRNLNEAIWFTQGFQAGEDATTDRTPSA